MSMCHKVTVLIVPCAGRLYEHLDWMLYANMTMQAAWGLLMLWLVLMIAGDAVFTGKGHRAAGGLRMQHI